MGLEDRFRRQLVAVVHREDVVAAGALVPDRIPRNGRTERLQGHVDAPLHHERRRDLAVPLGIIRRQVHQMLTYLIGSHGIAFQVIAGRQTPEGAGEVRIDLEDPLAQVDHLAQASEHREHRRQQIHDPRHIGREFVGLLEVGKREIDAVGLRLQHPQEGKCATVPGIELDRLGDDLLGLFRPFGVIEQLGKVAEVTRTGTVWN